MLRVLLDERVDTDYGQLDLVWGAGHGFDGDVDRFFRGQSNGLAGAASGDGLYLMLARRSGGSPVRVELWEADPGPSPEEWEDVVEVSVAVPPDGTPRWQSWAVESGGPLDLPGGRYRVRVSARGRDAGGVGEAEEGDVDFYLLQLWPAPPGPDRIVRTTSSNAAYWHREFGSRRRA